ncbi:ParA family protein [Nonomuraea aridisoli]|uniref:Peptide transporter n=1 Tax=Nonomuraea aridisoli TaxID=2070368 RepID=A0A2W2F4I9_9ACTN|nr:ParA family protein [Nonomuraea aridisoli]PZG19948.1 peptide transporter [Nonomuraea aridisoli]
MAKAKVHVVLSQKGGVGKSTSAVHLAAVTADTSQEQDSTVVLSIDPQGSAVWWAERVVAVYEELLKVDEKKAAARALPFHFVQGYDSLDELRELPNLPGIKNIWVDTPGWIPTANPAAEDPFDDSGFAEALRTILSVADDVLIPIEPEPLAFEPTYNTIEHVVKPRGLPYMVVVNNWDPRDGESFRDQTIEFIDSHGWNRANTVVRHYRIHTNASADGLVVTTYPKNRVSLEARQDFYKLALEFERMPR